MTILQSEGEGMAATNSGQSTPKDPDLFLMLTKKVQFLW
jgi:hypothetical protein